MDDDYIEDIQITIKTLILGNGGVGKSSLALRYAKETFTDQYKKTLGVDFLQKKKFIKSVGQDIEFHIWDTAGQEYFDSLTRRYYKGANAAILVFSCTDRDSFLNIKKWKEKLIDELEGRIPMILVMNKVDVPEQEKVVTEKEAENLGMGIEMCLFKVSVKENLKIDEIFDMIAFDYFKMNMNRNSVGIKADIIDVAKGRGSEKVKEIKTEEEKEKEKEQKRKGTGFKITNNNNNIGYVDKEKKKKCC